MAIIIVLLVGVCVIAVKSCRAAAAERTVIRNGKSLKQSIKQSSDTDILLQ